MKKNGFVFIETIVVISVLSVILLLLFSSYSFMLRKSRERETFDNIDLIYKTYYIKDVIDKYKASTASASAEKSVIYYAKYSGECSTMDSPNSFECDYNDTYNGIMFQVKTAYELEKIYVLNPYTILNSSDKDIWLLKYDATTIDYINKLGKSTNKDLLIAKYKKIYADGKYEVFHASIEV